MECQPWNLPFKQYNKLIIFIHLVNKEIRIICSAVEPQPWDDGWRENIHKLFNDPIRFVARQHSAFFIATDGLHFLDKGSWALTSFFADKIHKAETGDLEGLNTA